MPELPDVEGFRRVLADHATGRRIKGVSVFDRGVLRGVSVSRLEQALTGASLGKPWRHGKWLVVPVTGGKPALILHFGMTGGLFWVAAGDRHRHDRVVLHFDNGDLSYRDMRKLQGLRLAVPDRVLAGTGPDALELPRDDLRGVLGGQKRQIKAALVDQSVLAGLGNLLADEILWRARIHPRQVCAELDNSDFARLHAKMGTVLKQSIKDGRVPSRKSWLTGRRDEESGSCPRCGTVLKHGRVNGRGTVWCPRCQGENA
ncbi:Fpg/Nei family DNA glycosylase [Kibdelosporangium aridum]|uniref:Fpg/Nei family DNA glycosylase n=1 Tax=Kibdelosporangium aridum TaxID=2030 RepID=UPI00052629B1